MESIPTLPAPPPPTAPKALQLKILSRLHQILAVGQTDTLLTMSSGSSQAHVLLAAMEGDMYSVLPYKFNHYSLWANYLPGGPALRTGGTAWPSGRALAHSACCPYKKRTFGHTEEETSDPARAEERPGEDTDGRPPSAGQGQSSQRNQTCPHLDLQILEIEMSVVKPHSLGHGVLSAPADEDP